MPSATGKIGDWTQSTLTKFIQDALRNNPPQFTVNQTIEKITCTDLLKIVDQMQFMRSVTTATAGTAGAPPAQVAGYFEVLDPSGNVKKVPFYNA
jgi:hypothetical protein